MWWGSVITLPSGAEWRSKRSLREHNSGFSADMIPIWVGVRHRRSKNGGAPYVMKDGVPQRLELHHSRQDARGPLFELSEGTHRAKKGKGRAALHPYGNTKHPKHPVDRKKFGKDKKAYWKARAAEAQKK